VLKSIGDLQAYQGKTVAASISYREARNIFLQIGDQIGIANVLLGLARMNNDAEYFEFALKIYGSIPDIYSIALCEYYFAMSKLMEGDSNGYRQLLTDVTRQRFKQ
jgi:hypothetical protein